MSGRRPRKPARAQQKRRNRTYREDAAAIVGLHKLPQGAVELSRANLRPVLDHWGDAGGTTRGEAKRFIGDCQDGALGPRLQQHGATVWRRRQLQLLQSTRNVALPQATRRGASSTPPEPLLHFALCSRVSHVTVCVQPLPLRKNIEVDLGHDFK